MKVLLTGCSKHSKEIVDCLKSNFEKRPVRVIAVDMNFNNILRHNTDTQYIVPKSSEPNYVSTLIDICKKEYVDIVIPYITSELLKMSQNKKEFENNGIKVSVSNEKSIQILNDKVRIAEEFKQYMPHQFVVTNKYDIETALHHLDYPSKPVCVKIPNSCGGNGFAIVDDKKAYNLSLLNKRGVPTILSKDELIKYIEKSPAILQEYITGKGNDYSLCVLANKGKIVACCGYYGYSMEYGAVCNGEIALNEKSVEIAEYIVQKTKFSGNACFDYKIDSSNNPILLECNPRINASLGFCNAAGLNLVYLQCKLLLGENIDISQFHVKTGLKMRKFYESEYYV